VTFNDDENSRRRVIEALARHRASGGTFSGMRTVASGTFSGMRPIAAGIDTIMGRRIANAALGLQQKPFIFVSYHHRDDREYYERFSRTFCGQFDVVHDKSPDRPIDSENPKYVWQRLREKHITGSSCTIVLVGRDTWGRKYVDWEIDATLDKQHGLIGVLLPSMLPDVGAPLRLDDNVRSGYALWVDWARLIQNPAWLPSLIEQAKARPKQLIDNSRRPRYHNAPSF